MLLKMLNTTKPYWHYLLLALILGLLEIGVFLLTPYIFNNIFIEKVLINKNASLFNITLIIYGLLIILTVIFGFFKELIYKYVNEKVTCDLRLNLYDHLRNDSDFIKVKSYKTGALMSYFTNDITNMAGNISGNICEIIKNIFRLIIALIIMATINIPILIIIILLLPLYLFNAKLFNKPIVNTSLNVQKQNQLASESLEEMFNGLEELTLINKFTWEFNKLKNVFSKQVKVTIKNTTWLNLSSETGYIIYWLVTMVVYFIGGNSVLKGTMTVGTLLFYAQYIDNIYMPARCLIDINNNIQNSVASAKRYFHLIEDTENTNNVEHSAYNKSFDKITLKNVNFKYNDEYALKNINMDISRGEVIALVGKNGSGKSTLSKIILNLYKPYKGDITIDSKCYEDINKNQLYDMFGVVFQRPVMFSETIYNNITLVNDKLNEEDLFNITKSVNAHEFILQLENGYNRKLGENGVVLSGGQTQKIAFARALAKDTPIILLDEPTSALDKESKSIVYKFIDDLKVKNKTVIIITHDIDILNKMDKVILLDKGEILAKGSHKDLLSSNEIYKAFINHSVL